MRQHSREVDFIQIVQVTIKVSKQEEFSEGVRESISIIATTYYLKCLVLTKIERMQTRKYDLFIENLKSRQQKLPIKDSRSWLEEEKTFSTITVKNVPRTKEDYL